MTDAVDARLLGAVAEMGRAAVHEVAARLGMDPREAASRLVALSAAGLPLLVGVECDPNGLRAALARMQPQPGYGHPQQYQQQPVPQYQPPSPYQQQPPPYQPPSGPHPVPQPHPSGPHPVAPPTGSHQVAPHPPARTGPPSQPFPAQQPPPQLPRRTRATRSTPGARPRPRPGRAATSPHGRRPDGPHPARPRPTRRDGKVGEALETEGLEGERLSIKLIEVVDPADYLFTAAGYRLQPGERSIVVHTELVNRGTVKFGTLPDLYLVLVTDDGREISKAPVSLSSRPAHRIGVAPGETAGGHTVYVVPEETNLTSVRWSPRPDEESRTLTWVIEN
ncbi:AsnC family protein [Actinokineospora soli]|uniref:AsnC family protein n=1 Tax=Actinokineospora soli TaxID=1048753 RepID=A0ABW2TSH4_9PSEU